MGWNVEGSGPIWMQLHRQLMQRISSGVYPRGSKIPTVRELAAEAGVNPNTMQRALSQLEADGLVVTNRTAGMEQLGFTRQQAIDLVQTWKEEER